jgi:riboflavin kinase/FMN adenylyltransferase
MTILDFHVPGSACEGCIAIGNFDGVHRGHAVMLQQLRSLGREIAGPAVAITFDPHPIAVLRPEFTPPVLTTIEDRKALLRQAGADEVIVLPVTSGLLEMTAEQFFRDVVVGKFKARGVVEGPNFHFGKDRRGDVNLLQELCRSRGIQCHIAKSFDEAGSMVSSSRIRELICARAMAGAVELLGHPYRLSGVVRHGAGRGRTIGFPTANLAEIQTLLPAHGVYAGATEISGNRYPVAVSIGPNPTFGEHREKVECHIDGFSGNLYDQKLAIDLLKEVRALQSFSSVDELIFQIRSDVEVCRSTAKSAF